MKLILGVSGASGIKLVKKFIKYIPNDIQLYIIETKNSHIVAKKEEKKNIIFYKNKDISAPPASGSFQADAMIIIPCSMNSLAKIAIGISDNLLTRTASVMIKEKKLLILAPRELPYSTINLRNMLTLSQEGVVIAPPNIGYYAKSKKLKDIEKFLIGKWFDLLGIKHNLYKRWGE